MAHDTKPSVSLPDSTPPTTDDLQRCLLAICPPPGEQGKIEAGVRQLQSQQIFPVDASLG